MVEVTKENFENILAEFEQDLNKCIYYAVDCEFTFLPTDSSSQTSFFDDGCVRYSKIRDKIENCRIVQIGLAPFVFNRDLKEYRARIYKFYLFPEHFGSIDQKIVFKPSSVQYLCDNNFKFDKVFYDGITYLNKKQEEELRNEIKSEKIINTLIEEISQDERSKIFSDCRKIENWLDNGIPGENCCITGQSSSFNCLLHYKIRQQFPYLWTFQEKENLITVKRVTKTEKAVLEGGYDARQVIVDSLLGFSKVYNAMAESKKPIVGHNLFLDMLVMYYQFYEDLPPSFLKFKKKINHLFPAVYDTKFMSYELQTKLKKDLVENNSLENLYAYFKEKNRRIDGPQVYCSAGIYDSVEEQRSHDAGWDAFMTGYCFIKLSHQFAELHGKMNPLTLVTSIELLQSVRHLQNRINISRARVSHLVLDGPDPESTRPPLLYVEIHTPIEFIKLDKILDQYRNIHKRAVYTSSAILAAPNYKSYREVIKEISEHNLKIEKYSLIRHNKCIRRLLIVGLLIPFGVTIWSAIKKINLRLLSFT